jgi:hypothetical protein
MAGKGLYANIHAKRKRGGKMRKKGAKGAPTAANFARAKQTAKKKFKVYPSAYANAYASKICAGKIKDPSGVKRKDFRGPKPVGKAEGGKISKPRLQRPRFGGPTPTQKSKPKKFQKPKKTIPRTMPKVNMRDRDIGIQKIKEFIKNRPRNKMGGGMMRPRSKMMGGGMMKMPRAMYKKGGIAKGCGAVMSDRRKVTKVF